MKKYIFCDYCRVRNRIKNSNCSKCGAPLKEQKKQEHYKKEDILISSQFNDDNFIRRNKSRDLKDRSAFFFIIVMGFPTLLFSILKIFDFIQIKHITNWSLAYGVMIFWVILWCIPCFLPLNNEDDQGM